MSEESGATKLVKVMSGDRLHLKVDYYHNVSSPNNTGANGLSSMISSLLGALTNSPATGALIKDQASSVTSGLNASTDVTNFFSTESGAGGTAPKAYLHVLLFDERFKFDNVNSYVAQVSGSPGKNTFDKFGANAVTVKKNGYAYIYISNESDELVYFDNLMFTHERGRILEETHYYPFGLTMAGISSRSLNYAPKNKYKYGGKEIQNSEFSDESGIELYDFGFRILDPQIGRFHSIDPLADLDRRWTPFRYAYNNPMRFIDPDGLWEIEIGEREIIKKGKGTGKMEKYIRFVAEKGDNISTLAEQKGLSKEKLEKGLNGVEIKVGTTLEKLGVKSVDNRIGEMNSYLNNQNRAWNSNCFGTALSMSEVGRINFSFDGRGNGIIGNPSVADQKLQENFKQTENPAFGDVIRYAFSDGYKNREDFGYGLPDKGNEVGGTQHFAVFLLKTKSGDIYVFSKNGAGEKGPWVVTKDSSFSSNYGDRTPIGLGSPFYTPK